MPVIGTHVYRRSLDDLGRRTEIAHRVMRTTARYVYIEREIDWLHTTAREGPPQRTQRSQLVRLDRRVLEEQGVCDSGTFAESFWVDREAEAIPLLDSLLTPLGSVIVGRTISGQLIYKRVPGPPESPRRTVWERLLEADAE